MNKTAMNELIERMQTLKRNGHDDAGVRTSIDIATELLKKEKQQIMHAHMHADIHDNLVDAEYYYNQTFKKQ